MVAADAPAAVPQPGRYPELLEELAQLVGRLVAEAGIEAESARSIGESVAESVRQHYGGQHIYIAKGRFLESSQLMETIWAEFTGDNHAQLAMRYGKTVRHMYRLLAEMAARHQAAMQPRLPGLDDA